MSLAPELLLRFKSFTSSSDVQTQRRHQNSLDIIHRILDIFGPEHLCFSFNGGKDSTVVLHLIRIAVTQKALQISKETQPDDQSRSIVATNSSILGRLPVLYFESHDQFPQIRHFIDRCKSSYALNYHVYKCSFVEGVQDMIQKHNTQAIFMGVRGGDPFTEELEHITPSSLGWPPFLRINPILSWTYADVWNFLRNCSLEYCSLYDHGFTSLGNIYDTVENPGLWRHPESRGEDDEECEEGYYLPAYMLEDGTQERLGRQRHAHTTSK